MLNTLIKLVPAPSCDRMYGVWYADRQRQTRQDFPDKLWVAPADPESRDKHLPAEGAATSIEVEGRRIELTGLYLSVSTRSDKGLLAVYGAVES